MSIEAISDNINAAAKQVAIPQQQFSQADFLKMLITELSQQDPQKAVDSSKMMENFMQMASFQASMEAAAATKDAAATSSRSIQALEVLNQLALAQSLPGSQVEVSDDAGGSITGIVDKVSSDATNGIRLFINDMGYPLTSILSISKPTASPTTP